MNKSVEVFANITKPCIGNGEQYWCFPGSNCVAARSLVWVLAPPLSVTLCDLLVLEAVAHRAACCPDNSVHHFLFGVVPGFSLEEAHLEEQKTRVNKLSTACMKGMVPHVPNVLTGCLAESHCRISLPLSHVYDTENIKLQPIKG